MERLGLSLPWVGLVVALAVLMQQAITLLQGDGATFVSAMWQIGVIALGLTSIALILLPRRRAAFFLGFLICAALMGWAFWLQYGEGMDPCPLCMLQRVAIVVIGLIFLVGTFHEPGRVGAWIYAFLLLVVAGGRAPRSRRARCGCSRCRPTRFPRAAWACRTCSRRCRSSTSSAASSKGAANAPRRRGSSSGFRSRAGRSRSSSRSRSSGSRWCGAIDGVRPCSKNRQGLTLGHCGAHIPTPTGPAPSSVQFCAGTNASRVA